jgi:AcrR family transcriptional regulator
MARRISWGISLSASAAETSALGRAGVPSRRRYDSPLRRQQAAATRERIVAAGVTLLHEISLWNWRALTVRAVAEEAGVNERTVYRHFANERALRDAVLDRLRAEAGVRVEALTFDDLQDVTARIYEYVASFPFERRVERDETAAAALAGQQRALLAAVAPLTETWSDAERTGAAAILDVLWSMASYTRLVSNWDLGADPAIDALTWVIGLVQDAVRSGRGPRDRGT